MIDPFILAPQDVDDTLDSVALKSFQPPEKAKNDSGLGYSAADRIVALSGTSEGDSFSIYGSYKGDRDPITKRNWGNRNEDDPPKVYSYVDNFQKAFDAALTDLEKLFTHDLRLDERALIGEAPPLSFPDSGWSTDSVGRLSLRFENDLVLSPNSVEFSNKNDVKTLKFTERSIVSNNSVGRLDVGGKIDLGGSRVDLKASALDSNVSFLFDQLNDAGWEKVSPTWLATTEGFLRITDNDAGTIPYGPIDDTRPLDVTHWFEALPLDTRVFLLLDSSGEKTLTATVTKDSVEFKLEINAPALDFVLSRVTCDTSILADPNEPPGQIAVQRGPRLHLVSDTLLGSRSTFWTLKKKGIHEPIVATASQASGINQTTACHFAPHLNWVRPPQAGINEDSTKLSPLRVLIPKPQKHDPLNFGLNKVGITVGNDCFGAPEYESIAVKKFGPIARVQFDVAGNLFSDEIGLNQNKAPGVLRPEYRITPMIDSSGSLDLAPFSATYALEKVTLQDIKVAKSNSPSLDGGLLKFVNHDLAEVRSEASAKLPIAGFGWWNTQRFFKRASLKDHRLEWMQLDKKDNWELTPWLRLSDDSLVRRSNQKINEDKIKCTSDESPDAGWILDTALGTESNDDGLSLFTLRETSAKGRPKFELFFLEDFKNAVVTVEGQQAELVVNRLLMAIAPVEDLASAPTIGAVKVKKLNRLFLEFQRFRDGFRLKRGMLGWSATECYGLKANGDLHFTEFYELDEFTEKLERTVEFNGGLKSEKINGLNNFSYAFELYLWSSVLHAKDGNLRVICKHKFDLNGTNKFVVSVQDAIVNGEVLDISTDIAMFGENSQTGDTRTAADPWDASRRNLFVVELDDRSNFPPVPSALLQIRMASKESFHVPDQVALQPRLTPSWWLCNTEIIPWFAADLDDRRMHTSWVKEPTKLRTDQTDDTKGGRKYSVTLYRINSTTSLKEDSYRACTLAKKAAPLKNVIAQWIPSPITEITLPSNAANESFGDSSKLWMFDPLPRVIGEWAPLGPEQDRTYGQLMLKSLGWTRETVLEIGAQKSPPTQQFSWEIIDSPLLNRNASIGWLAWPLRDDDTRPQDSLPLSKQVVNELPQNDMEASVHVLFECDRVSKDKYSYPQVFIPASSQKADEQPTPYGAIVSSIRFRPFPLRVGTLHLAVIKNNDRHTLITVPPSTLPKTIQAKNEQEYLEQTAAANLLNRSWLSWGRRSVQVPDAIPALEDGKIIVTLALGSSGDRTGVIFDKIPTGLQVKTTDGSWKSVAANEEIKKAELYGESSLSLRLVDSILWSELRVTWKLNDGKTEASSFFAPEPSGVQLAGVFQGNSLKQFGYEPVWFEPIVIDDGSPSWNRVSGVLWPSSESAPTVATIDMFGRTKRYTLKESN
jgi:hypothetical protein